VFRRVLDTPSPAIPSSIMDRARALVVVPGARAEGRTYYGLAVLAVAETDGGRWAPPAITAFRGSIPMEIPSTKVDFVVIALSATGTDRLTRSNMVPVAQQLDAGPLEEDAREALDADLVGYMQFGDYFAGVPIDDWTLITMRGANEELYGRPYTTIDLLHRGLLTVPVAARPWQQAIDDYFRVLRRGGV